MPIQILMPALSPTMVDGTLARWLVREGDTVRPGDIIAEIETDKATMEVEAVDEGVIGRILVPAGTGEVKVNAPIAVLLIEGEAAGAAKGRASIPQPPAATPASGTSASATVASTEARQRVIASPLARRLAQERQIDLTGISGSGPGGRIVKEDVERAAAAPQTGAAQSAPAAAEPRPRVATHELATRTATAPRPVSPTADDKVLALYERGSYEIIPHSSMRRVIAERLTHSTQTIPHFRLSIDCRLDALLSARQRMNAGAPRRGPRAYRLTVNDFVIKAMALALQQVPAANATWLDGGMLRHKTSDVGVAVAVEDGLYTPVVRHAEVKSLSEISNEMKDLAERARARRLAPHEYQGGSTSISNLGMYGIQSFDAVINPPHATILAVGAGERRPVVAEDRVEIATVMRCTLSCDHRVVDGATAAALLAAFKSLAEDPVRMLV